MLGALSIDGIEAMMTVEGGTTAAVFLQFIDEHRAPRRSACPGHGPRFGVGRATVNRVLRLARETGSVEPAPHAGGVPRRVTEADQRVLEEFLRVRPDATLDELRDALVVQRG